MIRVLLVDDHPVVRAGLRAVLDKEDDIDVIGDVGDAASAIALYWASNCGSPLTSLTALLRYTRA